LILLKEINVLPLILASAAIVAPAAKAQAIQGPAVDGWVYNQAGKPEVATLGVIPMSLRGDLPYPTKVVQSQVVVRKKKPVPGYKLGTAPGLYILDVRAKGCVRLQVPILVGENGIANFDLTPRAEKPKGELKPISLDAKVVKWEALYTAQLAREQKYQAALRDPAKKDVKGPVVDWTADVEALAKDLQAETDADTQSFIAICYLELGYMRAKLDPTVAALALDKLPAKSPFWGLNPRVAPTSYAASGRNNDWVAFRDALGKDGADAEIRAYGLFAQLSSAAGKGDKDKQKALFQTLTTEYKDTRFGKSAKQFDPEKTPAPAPVAAAPVPAPAAAAAPAPAPAAEPAAESAK